MTMRIAFSSTVFFAVFSLAACGGDDAATTPAADTGTTVTDTGAATDTGATVTDTGTATDTGTTVTDTGTAADTGASTDTGSGDTGAAAAVNGCTAASAIDATTDSAKRTIAWSLSTGTTCIKIKKGQSITWNGSLSGHPLAAFGGDTPSPIPATSSGTTATVAFPNEGTFGFHCTFHSSMTGAIYVVP